MTARILSLGCLWIDRAEMTAKFVPNKQTNLPGSYEEALYEVT